MVLLPEKIMDLLKFGMQTQFDSRNNMGWVPSGHTSSSVCKVKMFKNGTSKKIF